jgi:hypothetical protein
VADLVAGVGALVLAGRLSNEPPPKPGKVQPFESKEVAPVFVGLGVVWVASSVFGFLKSNGCLDAIELQRACFAGQAEACRLLQEPPPATPSP